MTAPAPRPLVSTLVAIHWLMQTGVVGDRVSRTLPGNGAIVDEAKLASGWIVVPTVQEGASRTHQISFVAEVYYAPRATSSKVPWNSVEELLELLRRYTLTHPADYVTVPGRGDALITSVEYGGGASAVLGDLGNLARADLNLAFKWRPARVAALAG